jgi:ribonuclease-3
MTLPPLSQFCDAIGYTFRDISLLEQALSHKSYTKHHNERLEFLGDALLNVVMADQLYHQLPDTREGQLSRIRASLVRGRTLADVARACHVGQYLRLGPGEHKSGGRERDSILEDAIEAVIGAIYLDSNFDTTQRVVKVWFADRLTQIDRDTSVVDAKSALQEWLQGRNYALPHYETTEISGKAHEQTFHVTCHISALGVSVDATGSSRKLAEQAAAQVALKQLEQCDE